MAYIPVTSGRILKKRRMHEVEDCDDNSVSTAERVECSKRMRKMEAYAEQFTIELPSTESGSTSASDITENRIFQERVAELLDLREGTDTSLYSDSGAAPTEIAETASVSLALDDACSSENFSSGASGIDEIFSKSCSPEKLSWRERSPEEAESCCGEDTQLDINSFLELWDEDKELFSPSHLNVVDGVDSNLPPVPGACQEIASEMGLGAEWFSVDVGNDGMMFWNEIPDQGQEWMSAAFSNLDRLNDTCENEASMFYLLESGVSL